VESNGAAPSNVYAFSKAIMATSRSREAKVNPSWTIIGLRYSTSTVRAEAHKGVPRHGLSSPLQQMKAGQRPRIFKQGDQKRRFRYVKDVIEGSILALRSKASGIYNLARASALIQ